MVAKGRARSPHRAEYVNEQLAMDDGMSPSRKRMAMRLRRRCEDTPPYLWPNTYGASRIGVKSLRGERESLRPRPAIAFRVSA